MTGSDEAKPFGAVGRSPDGGINAVEADGELATGAQNQFKALLSIPDHLGTGLCAADATAGQESGEVVGDRLRQPVME